MQSKWLIGMLYFLLISKVNAQLSPALPPEKATVLVLGFSNSQFDCNVYSVDELAYVNDTVGLTSANASRVIRHYNQQLLHTLGEYSSEKYRFVQMDSSEAALILKQSVYVDWKNEFKESYVSLQADSLQDSRLMALMQKYKADYLLSINFYEIYSGVYPDFLTPAIRSQHRIDYEFFTPTLAIATAGRVTLSSMDIRSKAMQKGYNQFARQALQRLDLVNSDPATAQKKYYLLRDQSVSNAWGTGLSVGWQTPYGLTGVELVRNIGYKADINAGLGMAFSGFKIGLGFRYYLLKYGKTYKPFLSAAYAWASGMQIAMGGEKDENGNQLKPDEVSTFRIPADHAVHLQVGFRWLRPTHAFLLGGGYVIPFRGTEATLASGMPSEKRQRIANAYAVGGFGAGFTYVRYFRKVE